MIRLASPLVRSTVRDVADDLAAHGVSVCPGFVGPAACAELLRRARRLEQAGAFRAARVGYGDEKVLRPDIRSDHVRWIDPETARGAPRRWCQRLDRLRLAVNRTTYAGLFGWEGHFAHYPVGARYRRHIDTHRGDPARRVSTILYLNPTWDEGDGGQLRLWLDDGDDAPFVDIPPLGGTLVAFWSDIFPHEVLRSNVSRYSVTGWFRTRS